MRDSSPPSAAGRSTRNRHDPKALPPLVARPLRKYSEADLLAYEVLANRSMSHNYLMWQTPALALTAQAFLLTIALGHDTSTLARCLSSSLSAVVGLISWQLMAKHGYLVGVDRDRLVQLEDHFQITRYHARDEGGNWLTKRKSSEYWRLALLLFAAVGAAIFVLALAQPSQLATSSAVKTSPHDASTNPPAQPVKPTVPAKP